MNLIPINKNPTDLKVVVAMSGGVDSSVVACLLKEQGYQVIGITLQLYDHGEALKKKNACCAGVDIMDAKNVAAKYDFPHYVLNYENIFKESVIDDFADSYLRGETPLPCVRCNNSVKFRDLLKMAKDLGANCMATGHYVRRINDENNQPQLLKGVDENKDQSYFLFSTTKKQLDFLYFPLGAMNKEETRKHALRLGLEVADKPDSQDICFVPNGDYTKVITKLRPSAFKKGKIIHIQTNKILGEHEGIINYTLGQRRGLGIAYPEPLFVVKIDPKENTIFVGSESNLQNKSFVIKELNWLADEYDLSKEITTKVRLRSNQKEAIATIKVDSKNNSALIEMLDHTRAITPGQACVIYDNDRVLGGGWITKEII
jgi:tRNA-specific 2-thiouridylase